MTLTTVKKSSCMVDLGPLLILLAMVFWFSHEMLWGGKVPFFRDLGSVLYPMRFSLAEGFALWELPLWNRHMGMGFPLLASFQSGTFYPPHLTFLFLPFFAAIQTLFVFHYLVAATGAYCLCRRWGYSPSLALIGGILFTFGGLIVSLTNLLAHFQTAVWLPWAVLLWERCLLSGRRRDIIFLTLVLLAQFLAGAPEFYVLGLVLLLLDGLRLKSEETRITYRKLFLIFLGANGLVAGLAMVQILPTLELLMESRANNTISYPVSVRWSLNPLSLLNLSFLDRAVVPDSVDEMQLFFVKVIPWILSIYMGILALPGICLWFLRSSSREKTILLGLLVVTLVLALGGNTPIYYFLFRTIPFFSLFRFPEKFFFLTNSLLLFIILRGLYRFLQSDDSTSRQPFLIFLSMCVLFVLTYLFLRMETELLARFISQQIRVPLNSALTVDRTFSVLVNLERQIALTFGIALLFFFGRKIGTRTRLFKGLLVLLIFIDLDSAHRPYQFLLNPDFVYKNPRIIAAPDPEPNRLFYYSTRSNLHPGYRTIPIQPSFAEFYSVIFSNLLPNTGVFHGFDYLQDMDSMGRWSYFMLIEFASKLPPESQYRLIGALNVKHINSFQPLADGDVTLLRHFPEYPSWLYRLNRTVPRTYIVPEAIGENDPLKIMDRLSSEEFDPLKQVILEGPLTIVPGETFHSQAKIVRYKNQYAAIQASLSSPGVLVLADSYYPGWRVYVDGEEKEILRANYFFRSVTLPAGEHLVEFYYQPRSFTMGLTISLITLFGIIVWSILACIRNKQKSISTNP